MFKEKQWKSFWKPGELPLKSGSLGVNKWALKLLHRVFIYSWYLKKGPYNDIIQSEFASGELKVICHTTGQWTQPLGCMV